MQVRSATAIASVLLGAPSTTGQEPPTFSERVEVRVVELEVAVRSRDGTPVRGLGRDDFRLWVDGEVVPIEYFFEYGPSGSHEVPLDGAVSREPEPAPPSPEVAPVNVLLYIDEEFSLEVDLERVLRALEIQLARLAPQDRVAIVAWDGRRLTRLLDWTAPGEAVRSALSAARERPAWGLRTRLDEAGWGAEPIHLGGRFELRDSTPKYVTPSTCIDPSGRPISPCYSGGEPTDPRDRLRVLEVGHRMDRTARAAAAAVRSVPPPEGRRILALLSGGWPVRSFGFGGMLRVWDPLLDVVDQLRYSIYAVDVPGMSAFFLADVEYGGFTGSRRPVDEWGLPPSPLQVDHEGPVHYTLRYLGERTGGEALIDWERRHIFARISAEARAYYSLGFSADRFQDDSAHSVRVEVLRQGLEVRSRRFFRDLSTATERELELEAALLADDTESAAPPLAASLGEPARVGLRRSRVPLRVRLPEPSGNLDSKREQEGARFELRIAAVDEVGRRTIVGPVRLTPASASRVVEVPILLRRLPHEIAVALYDLDSDEEWLAKLPFTP